MHAELTAPSRHPSTVIAAHWLTVVSITAAVAAVLLREVVEAEDVRAALLSLHRQAGLSVLVLLAIRLVARLTQAGPDGQVSTPVSALMRWMAMASHGVLYGALIGLPLLGWALSDARGQHLHWLGVLPLPTLLPADPDMADTLEDWHRWSAWGLAAMVTLHVSAALWHHWVRRDDVLRAMLPRPTRASHSNSTTAQGNP